jgi:hypothetical protein
VRLPCEAAAAQRPILRRRRRSAPRELLPASRRSAALGRLATCLASGVVDVLVVRSRLDLPHRSSNSAECGASWIETYSAAQRYRGSRRGAPQVPRLRTLYDPARRVSFQSGNQRVLEILREVRDTLGLPNWLFVIALTIIALGAIMQGMKHLGPPLVRASRSLMSVLLRRPKLSPEEQSRANRRARFARDQVSRLTLLDDAEDWSDHQFAELDLEVESEIIPKSGVRRLRFIPSASRRRRERSLTAALESFGLEKRRRSSGDRKLVAFLQGEPGSGKSVALRKVARDLAERARAAPRSRVVPLYINLKTLQAADREVNADLIRDFVLESLRARGTSYIDRFLHDEFDYGLEHGYWLFLFDSFDEIPAVLASTEYDEAVRQYADAIQGFLEFSLNGCNGVIASRYFRAPPGYGWPTMKIAKLSPSRQAEVIRKANIAEEDRILLEQGLPNADEGVAYLAANPMFLGLLCSFVGERHVFPETSHEVFEQSIESRLSHDQPSLESRGVTAEQVRIAAEELAFAMTASDLQPARDALLRRRVELGFPFNRQLPRLMDALEYLQLAHRPSVAARVDEERPFTFAHRRFQEYFATGLVLRRREFLDVDALLLDGRWRETAVTVCQTQTVLAQPLLMRAAELLEQWSPAVDELGPEDLTVHVAATRHTSTFTWPAKALHVLELLQSGFPPGGKDVPPAIREPAARLVRAAFESGRIYNQRWAVDVAGVSTVPVLIGVLRAAFASRSAWLRDGAYQQLSRLETLHEDLRAAIRRMLLFRLSTGTLRRDRPSEEAQLRRLAEPVPFLQVIRQLRLAEVVNFASHLGFAALLVAVSYEAPLQLLIYLALIGVSYWSFYDLAFSASARAPTDDAPLYKSFVAEWRRWRQGAHVGWVELRQWSARRKSLRPPAATPPVRVRAVVRLLVRGLLLLNLFAVSLSWVSDYALWSAVGLLLVLGLMWSHAAIVAVARGEYTAGLHRSLAPLSFFRAALSAVRMNSGWAYVFMGGFIVALFGAIAGVGYVTSHSRLAWWVSVVISGVGLSVALCALCNWLLRYYLYDLVMFARWRSYRGENLSMEEFVARLAMQRTGVGVLRVVSTVRENNLLENVGELPDLILDVEELVTSDVALMDSDGSHRGRTRYRVAALNAWHEPSGRESLGAVRAAGPDLMDELAQLLKQTSVRPAERALAPVARG